MTWLRNETGAIARTGAGAACDGTGRATGVARSSARPVSATPSAHTSAASALLLRRSSLFTRPSSFVLRRSPLEQFPYWLDSPIDDGHRPTLGARQLLVDVDAQRVHHRRGHGRGGHRAVF